MKFTQHLIDQHQEQDKNYSHKKHLGLSTASVLCLMEEYFLSKKQDSEFLNLSEDDDRQDISTLIEWAIDNLRKKELLDV